MEQVKGFLKRKNIVISAKRYGIDALGAMAQGLFCSLLIGTILNTIGTQFHIGFLTAQVITINGVGYTIGGLASFMSGSAMAVAIGYALQATPMVLFSLVTVGYACNALGGAGGPLAVLFVAIIAAEVGKAVSKETKVDILVTPIVTILVGVGAAWIIAPPYRRSSQRLWPADYADHGAAALLHGRSGVRAGGHRPDAAHLLRRHLLRAGTDRTGRRCRRSGLLRQHGGVRRPLLPGKPLGRTGEPGHRHLHAADAQHREEPPHLAPCHPHLRCSPDPWPPAFSSWR